MKSLIEDIKTGKFNHVYLLYGEESYLVQQYKGKLKSALVNEGDTMNFSAFAGKEVNPKALIDLGETMPFFAERRVIFVENSGMFKGAVDDDFVTYLEHVPDTTYFVFVEEDVDKRSRMFKQLKKCGSIVEFKRQTEQVLMQWVLGKLNREGKKISRSVMELFLSHTGDDMHLIDRELEKLLCYTMDKEIIEAADVEAVCSNQVSAKIFEMVDAIAGKDQKRALDLYYDLLILKEPPMRILFMINRQFQLLMQLKALAGQGFDYKYMAQKMGVQEFVVRKNIGQARRFSTAQLKNALRDGVQADEDVKTGRMGDQLSVELLIVKYSSKDPEKEGKNF